MLNNEYCPFGLKIETTQKRRSWQICRGAELRTASRVNFGCGGLMQYDIGRPVAALELLAGATWAGVVSAGIRHLVELSRGARWVSQ